MQEDAPRASAYFVEALRIFDDLGDELGIAETIDDLAGFAAPRHPARAARLLGAAKGLRDRIGAPRHSSFDHLTKDATERAVAGAAEFDRQWREGYTADTRASIAAAIAWMDADALGTSLNSNESALEASH